PATPPTSTSTPFPYTTLFRSLLPCRLHSRAAQGIGGDRSTGGDRHDRINSGDPQISPWSIASIAGRHFRLHASSFRSSWRHGMRDRKSTRLNSSHVSISYAVF